MSASRNEGLIRDRQLLIDGVQAARLRYELTRMRYAAGGSTATEFLTVRNIREEAEAALRAHVEVYGEVMK